MPDPMTGFYEGSPRAERVEVITSVQRRRRWSTEEKVRIVEETYLPGNSVSLVARRHGIAGNQLFTWRRLMAQGALTAAGAGEEVVPASELRAAHQQIRELQRLLGKKTLENAEELHGTRGSDGWPASRSAVRRSRSDLPLERVDHLGATGLVGPDPCSDFVEGAFAGSDEWYSADHGRYRYQKGRRIEVNDREKRE